ncbi:MAG TPA: type II secretion system protein [Candidatus Sumerlaeota bacterium]|nr:type II secretion system protein [Candidatus Sumerlaeota bacterium]HON51490.1 type II secretion system protein [Candidatus Sumerlaeota bacterium]HRR31067.1 type II secretion system protein [Candidatus Sumerlaeia bacterium]
MAAMKKHLKGITLLELLVAIAISGIFLTGVLEAFVYIIRTTDRAETQLEAVTNARSALERMAIDIKAARIDPRYPIQHFVGESLDLPYGDGIDNDGDGRVDEEIRQGADDDGDFQVSVDDLHVAFDGGVRERSALTNFGDLGDRNVDEDCRFSADTIEFITYPDLDNPGFREQRIRYAIGDFDGQTNVLIREVIHNPNSPTQMRIERDPIAFNVLSLSFLYWDPNRIPMNWVTTWDSLYAPLFPDPQIELPAAVHICITVYAGSNPFNEYRPGDRVETITLETIVTNEQVLKDARYKKLL